MGNQIKAQAIIDVVQLIPFGRVSTYGQVADLAGWPGRARAVGRVLKTTPSGVEVPWHRVIRADGTIAFPINGPQGQEHIVRLRNEGVNVNNGRIHLSTYQWQPNIKELLFSLRY